jgi:hypothetical protein
MSRRYWPRIAGLTLIIGLLTPGIVTDPPLRPIKEPYSYVNAMTSVARRFRGVSGVFLHIGDSNTYASANTACARTPARPLSQREEEFLRWSHQGDENAHDGWWLASVDVPGRMRSHTAAAGMRAAELLTGGTEGLPPLSSIIAEYNPQLALYMVGTNDARDGRSVAHYIADVERAIDMLLANGTVPILSTLPPLRDRPELIAEYCDALRALAARKQLPLIDLTAEMVKRAGDQAGSLMRYDGTHLSIGPAAGPDTEANLKRSGYLLRCHLAIHKGIEVKALVFDAL